MGDRRGGDRTAVGPNGEVLTQAEVEQHLMRLTKRIEEMSEEHQAAKEAATEAKIAWRKKLAEVRMRRRVMPGSGPGGRQTESELEDYVIHHNQDLYDDHIIKESLAEGLNDSLFSLRDAAKNLQSINANIRGQT